MAAGGRSGSFLLCEAGRFIREGVHSEVGVYCVLFSVLCVVSRGGL